MACVPISATGHDLAAEIGGTGGESHRCKEMGTVMSLVATDSNDFMLVEGVEGWPVSCFDSAATEKRCNVAQHDDGLVVGVEG